MRYSEFIEGWFFAFLGFVWSVVYWGSMSKEDLIKYWLDTAEEDWQTTESLLSLGRYMQALFYVHIALEKYLKGLIVKNGADAPFDHNLLSLAKTARIDLDNDQLSHLTEINTFNIRARYDDYKRTFYKKATKEYAEEYFNYAKQFQIWIKKMYQKK